MGTSIDTSRQPGANALSEVLRLRERAMDATSNGILITDAGQVDNPIIYVNRGFERLSGYTAEECLGRNCRFLQGRDTDQAAREQMRDAVYAGRECHITLKNYRKDGKPFWNELFLSPVREGTDGSGPVTHFAGIQNDVTARIEAEVALRESEERARAVVERCADAIGIVTSTVLTYANAAFVRLVGAMSTDDLVGHSPREFVHQDDWLRFDAYASAIERGEPVPEIYECRFLLTGGPERLVEQSAARISYGGQRATLLVARDITDRRRRERLDGALLVARTVAHKINNALAPISGFAELLTLAPEVAASPTLALYTSEIRRAADLVASHVQSLQRITRLEEVDLGIGPSAMVLDLSRSSELQDLDKEVGKAHAQT